jgi:Helix-turn-helix
MDTLSETDGAAADVRAPREPTLPKVPRRARPRLNTLKDWRTATGVNQREAAAAFGMTQAMYSRLERRDQFAKPQLAKRLSLLTGVDIEVLLGLR